jgi:hypothetical protein
MPNFKASQTLAFSRRTLLTGLTGLCLVSRPQPQRQSPLPDAPPPKFWFGDRVIDRYWGEHPQDMTLEIEIIERGTVVGLAWGKDFYYYDPTYQSWWYWVKWDSEPDEALTSLRFAEKDLEPERLTSLSES